MKKQKNNYKKFNIILGVLMVAMAIALMYCSFNIKSVEDKEYLDLREHLLSRFISLNYQKENQICEMESYGLSKDREISVRFWCQNYDKNTDSLIGNKEYHTLYFQHPTTTENTINGYAEALGE